jgi:3,4-dihydroxy-2-butanone 4-phosphate synthase
MNDIQQLVYDMEVLTTRDRPPTFDNWEDFVELVESRPAETMRIDWDNEAIGISAKETYWTIISLLDNTNKKSAMTKSTSGSMRDCSEEQTLSPQRDLRITC